MTRKQSTTKTTSPASTARVLVLRTCNADLTAHGGFQWPESGHIAAPDWKPSAKYGNGLHGLLWGCGDPDLLNWSDHAKWLVVSVDPATMVDLDDKVKFPSGDVIYCGDRAGATQIIAAAPEAAGKAIIGATVSAGDAGTATAGARGTATAGARGTATAGDAGTATAGARGTATAGDAGTATAGDAGTATAGDAGTATAGARGAVLIRYWTGHNYAIAVGIIGQNGIEPNVAYRVSDERGTLVKAE